MFLFADAQAQYLSNVCCTVFPRSITKGRAVAGKPRDAAVIFERWRPAAILNLIESEIASFDPATMKAIPRAKHAADRITRSGHMAIRIFLPPS